jgi:hypothetical protein
VGVLDADGEACVHVVDRPRPAGCRRAGPGLLAINAGSGTLTSFRVEGTKLKHRRVVDAGGEFPSSIAVRGKVAYVMTAGGKGSVQGFRITRKGLVPMRGSLQSLGLACTSRWTRSRSPLNSTSSVWKSAHTALMFSSQRVRILSVNGPRRYLGVKTKWAWRV